ncbi:BMC domain-containing protein [Robertmurraya sp. P23]|uniref:BMC domain-containing protein n=1 Tax=Robertmurraya sp. P23 TaxID=3436931 RepID=UPI003D961025
MARNALGLIEVVGMTAAIVAADTAVKSANVRLLGYENSKGGGMITVKFEGDVGAVKAALEAASSAASRVNRIVSKHLIPRPSDEIEKMTNPKSKVTKEKEVQEEESPVELVMEEQPEKKSVDEDDQENIITNEDDDSLIEANDQEICNICKDPKCTRRKGEARTMCIHYHATVGGK